MVGNAAGLKEDSIAGTLIAKVVRECPFKIRLCRDKAICHVATPVEYLSLLDPEPVGVRIEHGLRVLPFTTLNMPHEVGKHAAGPPRPEQRNTNPDSGN